MVRGKFSKCQRPKTTRETSFLRLPARGGPVGENVEPKKVAQFSGETFTCTKRFPKKAPSSGKFRFSDFGPEFLQVPKAQNGPRNQFSAVSRPWGSGWEKMTKQRKVRNFQEELSGPRKDFPKWPPAPGNSDFLILARNFSKCQRPKTAQETSFLRFPARGGPVGKK